MKKVSFDPAFILEQRAREGLGQTGQASSWRSRRVCRNIRTLFNFEPPATDDEIRAASLQFVRKISGFSKPSQANEAVFAAAVDDVASVSRRLLMALESNAPAKDRQAEALKAKARAAQRFAR
jgi:hypothetical protein